MSKFNITKIEIENFRSIQTKVTLEIKPGLFAIQGINLDQTGSLNGAGKSTLVSALYWCITGNALTNEVLADDVINSKVGKNCKVRVTINSTQGEIIITRTRKDSEHGNNLFLEIAGQNVSCHKVSDTQTRINQLIKIPFDLLHSTIMMTSDMKSSFSKLTPQQRIQILESIRDYSVWDKVRDEANRDIKNYNKNTQDIKLKISNITGSLNTYETLNVSINNNITTLKTTLSTKNITHDKNILSNNINTLENDIKNEEKNIEDLKNITFVDNDTLQAILDKASAEGNVLKLDIQQLEFDIKNARREITIIDKWFSDSTCPTCNRKLERTLEEEQKQLLKKEAFEKEILGHEKDILDKQTKIQTIRTLWSTTNTSLQKNNQLRTTTTNSIQISEKKINEFKMSIVNVNSKLAALDSEQVNLTKQIEDLENTYRENMSMISTLRADVETKTNEILSIEAKRQLSEYFYKLLSGKGELRPYLLSRDIKYLNVSMQKYINRFFENTTVDLVLNGASIDIAIESNGLKKTVASLSGGEEKRLNFAVQLALYDLIQAASQVSFNTLWLDEVESKLDPLGCQQLIEVIEDKSSEIETVFWITNNETVAGSIQDKIICKKAMGKTEVIVK